MVISNIWKGGLIMFGIFGLILGFGIAILFVLFIIAIGLYLLFAFGLYTMGMKRGIELSWLAFIPIAQLYVVGIILKRLKVFSIEIPRPEIVLPLTPIVVSIVSNIRIIGPLAGIAELILFIAVMYYLFKMYKGADTAILYTVLSIIFWFMMPIFVFMMRNTDPIE